MNWSALLSAFGLVFIAELGDKTQLAVMTQTCKFRRPWPVFLGGSLALTAVTALGALGGSVLGELIPAEVIRLVAAAAFVVMGVLIWREATKSQNAECVTDVECVEDAGRTAKLNWQAFGTTFTLLFFAELGDKTQLAVLGLSSKQAALPVFAGGALALTVVTALGVIGGQQLSRWIPEKLLLKISAAAFVVMGVLMGLGIL
ncbi:MAG TPA: TMEM165/GDT1 family protein [Anaerolineae bacterium]|nr:TMEM165/GDT1 family protein [Anaerolineae bacterium]HQK13507.1 TMEM165/GDT1 family protein [Anaerolineae bacterium]